MNSRTRKHIWPMSLVMSIAIIGALAAFLVLTSNPGVTEAHGGDQDPHCSTVPVEQIGHDVAAEIAGTTNADGSAHTCANPGGATSPGGGTGDNELPVVVPGILSDVSLRINMTRGPIDVSDAFTDADGDTLTYGVMSDNPNIADATVQNGMMTIVAGNVRGTATITVTANDGKSGMASISFEVKVAEAYILTAEPAGDPMLPPPPTSAVDPFAKLRMIPDSAVYVVSPMGAYDAKFHLAVTGSQDDVTVTITASEDPDGGITITDSDGLIGAGFVDDEETDLEGSFTVKATDSGSRAFEIEGVCEQEGAWAYIVVEDKDLDLVAEGAIYCKQPVVVTPDDQISTVEYSVASYGDWAYHDVTDGYIDANLSGVTHLVNDHPNQQIGWLERDEPVVNAYELGMSEVEILTQRDNPEEGQRTIEVLVGAPNVQLTVTSAEEGPAYIRFLDSNMEAFGTDVDEEPEQAGADVVGLDSQGRLEMNLMLNLSAAKALAYDQYDVVVPGNPSNNAYLRGNASDYYQGKFRFFNPCPSELGKGHHFYVEVYEKSGKYLKTTEKVVCILQPGIVPTELAVTTFSDIPRTVRLSWVEARTASAHWVIAINEATRIAAPDSLQRIASPGGTALITGLAEDTEYIFAVAAERVDANGDVSYSNASFIIQAMNWN